MKLILAVTHIIGTSLLSAFPVLGGFRSCKGSGSTAFMGVKAVPHKRLGRGFGSTSPSLEEEEASDPFRGDGDEGPLAMICPVHRGSLRQLWELGRKYFSFYLFLFLKKRKKKSLFFIYLWVWNVIFYSWYVFLRYRPGEGFFFIIALPINYLLSVKKMFWLFNWFKLFGLFSSSYSNTHLWILVWVQVL